MGQSWMPPPERSSFASSQQRLCGRHGETFQSRRCGLKTLPSRHHRPIRWIGSTEFDCPSVRDPQACWPIRIAAGALGPNKPACDLSVSPAHGVCTTVVSDILIPASALVNGATIVQAECEKVTYWHVELDEHDILFTSGLPTESYIDHRNRDFFSLTTGSSIRVVHGDGQRCLNYVSEGPLVAAVRMQLHARAFDMG